MFPKLEKMAPLILSCVGLVASFLGLFNDLDPYFPATFFLISFLISNLFAYQQKQVQINRTGAIIMEPSVNIKKTPAKQSADLFVLHEGTRVDITDKTINGWRGIRVADGREGWIETKHIEEI